MLDFNFDRRKIDSKIAKISSIINAKIARIVQY